MVSTQSMVAIVFAGPVKLKLQKTLLVWGNGTEKSSSRKITELRMNRICSCKEKNGIPGISTRNAKTVRYIDKGT